MPALPRCFTNVMSETIDMALVDAIDGIDNLLGGRRRQ